MLSGCRACPVPSSPRLPPPPSAFRGEARKILSGLDLDAKCGQVLLVAVPGKGRLAGESAAAIRRLGPGGILLFGYNIGDDPRELSAFVGDCQDASASSAGGLPLIVAIDHEGGSVFRFKSGLTPIPSAAEVGLKAPAYALALGEASGRELSALGVNLALAPVVELSTPANLSFLGDRSYGKDARHVDASAGAFIVGLESFHVASAAKHFPGNAGSDPHKGLPTLDCDRGTLEKLYLARFRSAISKGSSVVLLSHVLVPALDPENPATLSPALVGELLKKKLGFEGVVLTDDLFMRALTEKMPPEVSAVKALAAGADLLMLSDAASGPRVARALRRAVESGELPASRLDEAVLRVIELKLRQDMKAGLDPEERARRLALLPSILAEDAEILSRFKN